METYSRDGVPEGEYKVAVSYLVSADGVPQGLGPRGSQSQPPGMLTATERLKPEYADLGRTKLTAKVPAQGATFDFAVEALPPPPEGEAAPEPAKDPAKPAATEEPEPVATETPAPDEAENP